MKELAVLFSKSMASVVIFLLIDAIALAYILLLAMKRTEKNNLLEEYSAAKGRENGKNKDHLVLVLFLLIVVNVLLFIVKSI